MSLHLYLSHTGKRYSVDASQISSPETLKQWIASNVDVPVGRQILMTSAGKNVKQQHLVNSSQIFIYDKRFLFGEEPATIDDETSTAIKELRDPPSELENETSLASWQQLFKSRRAWSLEALDMVKNLSDHTADLVESSENIDRSANVALDNLRNHVSSLQNLFEKTQAWAKDTLEEHATMLREWRTMTQSLNELPIRDDVARLMQAPGNNDDQDQFSGTMHTFLDQSALDTADATLIAASDVFRDQVNNLSSAMQQLQDDSESASKLTQVQWPDLESESLVQEAETLAKKIEGDYNDVLKAGTDNKAISKVSRVAAGHTNDLLPGLQELVQESRELDRSAQQHRKNLSEMCFRTLRSISHIQSTLAELQGQISRLTFSEEGQQSLEVLDRVFRLPNAYGNVLVEAMRRCEWNDRFASEMQALKDDVTHNQEDEMRRRKKWMQNMSDFLHEEAISNLSRANNITDFSIASPANPWPYVVRKEVLTYLDDLRALHLNESAQQMTQLLRELDAPTKNRRLKLRPFKNGSIHESMQNSVMPGTPHEDVQILQDDKIRLEDKLRASESRIRKLEDLLHRQSQSQPVANVTRTSSGVFTPISAADFERQPSSPGPEQHFRAAPADPAPMSRRSSVSHQPQIRRLSNQTPDEKALVQRIVSLESQIATLKTESETQVKSLQEADSIKTDLLANFEAQRQEFEDERQRLEDDNHEMKIKFEEIEEELDRVVGSRDHERGKQDQAITHLRSELERVRRSGDEEVEQLRNTKEHLNHELNVLKEKYASMETQLYTLRSDRSSLQNRNIELANSLRKLENERVEIIGTLRSVHEQLSPAGSAPDTMKRLVSALEVLAEGATIHARGLDDALQIATAQGKANDEKIATLETQIEKLKHTKAKIENEIVEKDGRLRESHHMLDAVRAELRNERKQVETLQAQFAAGETGSDALRSRLAEEERKIATLTESRDQAEAQIQTLQRNLESARTEASNVERSLTTLRQRLEKRGVKAKDLSERLFQHNDRIIRMLENLGYSVSREGEGLIIQRASKVNASQILSDTMLGTPMKRQISGSMPVQHYSDPGDAQTLYWMSDEDENSEDAKYDAFLSSLSRLDIDSTIEIITKRYKDVETLAKKYQKDSRLHREKTHRLQSEAHEKIAYRGFKEGDLALFLPTRNQATKPWAAFNVGAPHYFLQEIDAHRLQHRDWLLARISKIEERVVDLSRSLANASVKGNADTTASDGASLQSVDDNPFELSDGLRWYLIEATEEKPGAPSTPGAGKSTVAASVVDVKAQIGRKGTSTGSKDNDKGISSAVNATKTLHKSLDSRRSSEASRKSGNMPPLRNQASASSAIAPLTTTGADGEATGTMSPTHSNLPLPLVRPSDADQKQGRAREDDKIFDVNRRPTLETRHSARSFRSGTASSAPRPETPHEQPQHSKPWDKLFSFQYQA